MGKSLYFRKKCYIYLKPSEEEALNLVIRVLNASKTKIWGIGDLKSLCRQVYWDEHKKSLSSERVAVAIWQLMSISPIPGKRKKYWLQVWEIRRKRYIRRLP